MSDYNTRGMDDLFWTQLDTLVSHSELVIDRPAGSLHPKHSHVVYPLDYGYLSDTSGGDGNEIDVWRGSAPEGNLDAIVCTSDLMKRDTEVKLLLGCTEEEKAIVCDFHSKHKMGVILVRRKAT
jgi:inorganic pyrophosphatase